MKQFNNLLRYFVKNQQKCLKCLILLVVFSFSHSDSNGQPGLELPGKVYCTVLHSRPIATFTLWSIKTLVRNSSPPWTTRCPTAVMGVAPLATERVESTAVWMALIAAVASSGTASREHVDAPWRGRTTNWACWRSPPAQSISPVTKRSQVSSLKSPNFRLLDPALIANVLMILRAVVTARR